MNKKDLYCVFAPRRSGHHAIVDWLINGLDKEDRKSYYMNDVKLCSFPYYSCAIRSMRKKHKDNGWKEIHNNTDDLIISYEDRNLAKLEHKPLIKNKKDLGGFRKEYNIIVIRDPFNNIASKIKFCERGRNKAMHRDVIKKWKIHAREAATVTNYLKNKIIINYNKWFISDSYRKRISSIFHFDGSKPLLSMAKPGRGSSFNKLDFDGRADQMSVLERWKEYKDNKSYILMINDSELVNLYRKLFDPIPEIKKILYT